MQKEIINSPNPYKTNNKTYKKIIDNMIIIDIIIDI